ncbi:MAG: DUF1501 domain-containing protein [Planctomycetes bacterium]|nr:DUF1501 domain-containing protein [Planctomycetota bacterium]
MQHRDFDTTTRPSRRALLAASTAGFGLLSLRGLAAAAGRAPARAKRVIFLCMSGAPSHVDTFDYKPELGARDGQGAPGEYRRGAKLLGSPWSFAQHGRSGLWMSELFPELARHADRLCLLHGMHTDVPAHAQATVLMHTGSFQFVRPSMGAWTLYGLGSANEDLPGFVTINPPAGQGGAQNYGSAFLPARTQGLRLGIERESRALRRDERSEPVENLASPRGTSDGQRRQLDLVRALDKAGHRKDAREHDAEALVESMELAFRMQAEVPELVDLDGLPQETLALYGVGAEETDGFARQCLLARRLAESGVRFIEVNQGGWDHHRNLREALPASCRAVDKPIAGLLTDLARSGLLEETLVLWGGEFGRTPYAQNGDGRDHNNRGFTTWMAGGGVRGGFAHGATDELGIEAVEGLVSIHDWHATVLHLLGLDHEALTYPWAGRDFRLTGFEGEGRVVREVLA